MKSWAIEHPRDHAIHFYKHKITNHLCVKIRIFVTITKLMFLLFLLFLHFIFFQRLFHYFYYFYCIYCLFWFYYVYYSVLLDCLSSSEPERQHGCDDSCEQTERSNRWRHRCSVAQVLIFAAVDSSWSSRTLACIWNTSRHTGLYRRARSSRGCCSFLTPGAATGLSTLA